jgi:hypothetical protein
VIDLFQSLAIVTACALDYVLQTEPLRRPGFALAGLRFFRHVPFGIHKAVRCRSQEITRILEERGFKGWTVVGHFHFSYNFIGAAILRRRIHAVGCGPEGTVTISVLGDRHEEEDISLRDERIVACNDQLGRRQRKG